jgi:hypothetical protein
MTTETQWDVVATRPFQLQTPEAAPVNIFACKERPGMEALTQFLAPEFAV